MVLCEIPGLTSRVTGCAYRMPLCSVWSEEQTAITSELSIITEMEVVHCPVRAESLHILLVNVSLERAKCCYNIRLEELKCVWNEI